MMMKPTVDLEFLELKDIFYQLLYEIVDLFSIDADAETTEEVGRRACRRIQEEVSDYPKLARLAAKQMWVWSLLTTVCEKTLNRDVGHETIKYLITLYPNALRRRWTDENSELSSPLRAIARNPCHCVLLLPWIAEHHASVFDHASVLEQPPHYDLVRNYVDGQCSASVVRSFYELYPQGLQQEDASSQTPSPLHACLRGREECDAGLFEWMAEQYPQAISSRDDCGMTLLFNACRIISSTVNRDHSNSLCTENMARICRFLMGKYPEAVRIPGQGGRGLPLHHLARRCNRPLIQDLVIAQLRLYPGAVQIRADRVLPELTAVPFIQRIQPLLQREAWIQEESAWLSKACTDLRDISTCIIASTGMAAPSTLTTGQHEANPFHAACVIFTSWAKDSLAVEFPAIEAEIQREIDRVKGEFEGEDMALRTFTIRTPTTRMIFTNTNTVRSIQRRRTTTLSGQQHEQ